MSTYSPFTRIRTVNFTAGQNQADRSVTTISKRSLVSVRYTGSGTLRTTGYITYWTNSSGNENIIAKTGVCDPDSSLNGVISGAQIVPAGEEIRTNFQTSSGTANFVLDIVEID